MGCQDDFYVDYHKIGFTCIIVEICTCAQNPKDTERLFDALRSAGLK
jgi:hypothetical protein